MNLFQVHSSCKVIPEDTFHSGHVLPPMSTLLRHKAMDVGFIDHANNCIKKSLLQATVASHSTASSGLHPWLYMPAQAIGSFCGSLFSNFAGDPLVLSQLLAYRARINFNYPFEAAWSPLASEQHRNHASTASNCLICQASRHQFSFAHDRSTFSRCSDGLLSGINKSPGNINQFIHPKLPNNQSSACFSEDAIPFASQGKTKGCDRYGVSRHFFPSHEEALSPKPNDNRHVVGDTSPSLKSTATSSGPSPAASPSSSSGCETRHIVTSPPSVVNRRYHPQPWPVSEVLQKARHCSQTKNKLVSLYGEDGKKTSGSNYRCNVSAIHFSLPYFYSVKTYFLLPSTFVSHSWPWFCKQ